ncbi:MAG: Hsp20/alpha crystallin family protein [Thermoanaerobaculales bacterium]|nr:Hsp20/alpha crystallin family protein [Thermoanaerobaculales bacterium]
MVTLTRFNPTTDTANLSQRMERLFDEMQGRGMWRTSEERPLRGSWVPAINILEREDSMVITADLPGLKAEDVEVTVEEGTLSIRGERKLDEASEGETYHRVERLYGIFERTFTLPNSIDVEKIEARFSNGEMVLTLPKREESKPRSVKIKVENN